MTKPLVSVIMPAFNAEIFIGDSIKSVINQTYPNWELIVVNDGSTDSTYAIAKSYNALDSRVIIIDQENRKLSAARNSGIQKARGQWIAFLDADDLWTEDKLEKQMIAAEHEPGAGVIFSDGVIFQDNISKLMMPYGTAYGFIEAESMYKLQYQGNHIPVLSAIVKKTLVDTTGLQDEQLMACEDWDYWLRLCLDGVSFYGMQEKLFYYRRHASNMSNDDSLMRFAKANVFLKNFRSGMLSKSEVLSLKSFINITICQFVKTGKIKEALVLNKKAVVLSKSPLRDLGSFLISSFKESSYYPLRSLFKLDRILYTPDV